ncbi:hypothetical protein [Micromonospora echinofusca]|uniref:Enamine deaminase RidA, house cleaning of reactive enamine intermediates, YjgF/YER057c/UK114 family n=1 Tax=Micromonospora echinofusca TaxID=47858 RepID=A0ABS3VLC7_MICEH|nr:hypothetical protein [Micromonospora echinofusca]MBO4205189.1 hypothetical protein [Micromonospora echinofusca]
MTTPLTHRSGAYRYLPGGAAFSNGLAAEAGFRIVEWEFATPQPLEIAFERVGRELAAHDRGWDALAGVDLRSPVPFDLAGFASFNTYYLDLLRRHYPLAEDEHSPLARTNVAPVESPLDQPSVRAVQVVLPDPAADGTDFVLSGVAENRGALGPKNTVAYRDTSAAGWRAKVDFVAGELAARLHSLGLSTDDARIVDVYVAQPLDWLESVLTGTFGSIAQYGLHHWPARPPVVDLDVEIGCKRLSARATLTAQEEGRS